MNERSGGRPRSRKKLAIFVVIVLIAGIAGVVLLLARQPTGPAEGTGLVGENPPPATQPAAVVHHALRIGTFNIDGGQGTDDVVDLARTASCLQHLDVIGLNEVHGFAAGSDPPNQAVVLAQLLRMPFLYVPSERRFGHDSFGNAFFCDLPVLRWQRIPLPNKPLHAIRNYLLSDVSWHGQTVHFLTTHVDWKSGGDEQLQIVTDVFLHLPEPAVLMGDLNHPPSSVQIEQLLATAGVEEAIHQIFGQEERPRVDWIFLRGLRTIDAGIVDLHASDHPAFWAEVTPVSPARPATRSTSRASHTTAAS